MEKPTIYLVQSGLGKTYFCQHNPGWADCDVGWLWVIRFWCDKAVYHYIDSCIKDGYKIVTSADPDTCLAVLRNPNYNVVLIRADKDMREELLTRVKERNDDRWGNEYPMNIDWWMEFYNQLDCPQILLHKGQYLSDILNPDGSLKER